MTNSLIVPSANDYTNYQVLLNKYKFHRLTLNDRGGNSIDYQPNNTQPFEFIIPSNKVFNLSKSYITYTYTVPAKASLYGVVLENGLDFASQVELTVSGLPICNLQYADRYVNLLRPLKTSISEYLNNDPMHLMYPVSNSNDSNSNYLPYSLDGTGIDTSAAAAAAAPVPALPLEIGYMNTTYRRSGEPCSNEIKYVNVCPTANTDMNISRQLPLSAFVDTILGMDKNLIFPENLILRITSQQTNKICYYVSDPKNPQGLPGIKSGTTLKKDDGTAATAAAGVKPTEFTDTITFKNIYLYLAEEQNEQIIDGMTKTMLRSTFKVHVPFVDSRRVVNASSKYSNTFTMIRGADQYLKYVIFAMYNSNEKCNTTYDHSNFNGTKVSKIMTQLRGDNTLASECGCYNSNYSPISTDATGIHITEFPMVATTTALNTITQLNISNLSDDYRENKKYLEGTPICNQMIYQNLWFYCDYWGIIPRNQKTQENIDDDNILAGLYLKDIDYTWTCEATVPIFDASPAANTPYYYYNSGKAVCAYTFVNYQKTLLISSGGVKWSGTV